MRRSTRSRALAAWLVACTAGSGCGVVEDALGRVKAWWDDGGEEAAPPGAVEAEAFAAADVPPDVGTRPASAGGPGSGPDEAGSTGGSGESGDGGTGSTSIPMSFAVPQSGGTGGDTGGPTGTGSGDGGSDTGAAVGTTGAAAATSGGLPAAGSSCLDGEWAVADDGAYYREQVRKQAFGRSVRRISRGGSYSVRIDRGEINVVATHRKLVFSATLADNEIRYTVDVHGELEAPIRLEGTDVMVVEAPRIDTLKASEVARFPGGKAKHRRLDPPGEGRYEYSCGGGVLELKKVVDGKAGAGIRLKRPVK